MRVLGFDPGLSITGYGCVAGDIIRPGIIEAGVFRLTKRGEPVESIGDRLVELESDVQQLVERVKPDLIAIEGMFAHKDHPGTVVKMAHARGVILLVARRAGVEVCELKPAEVKKAATGSGRATKEQMQLSVQEMFNLPELPQPADLADALAIAACALRRFRVESMTR
ncbi:MAG: crossover junction endodeoxyribonuclease RuvC [Phycisphaerales bacterium]|nr:crossover junction endodeoxyribonuclease RuvC [Phycisphaerales bacterium]